MGLTKKDIKKYFLSQFAKKSIDTVREQLEKMKRNLFLLGMNLDILVLQVQLLAFAKTFEKNGLTKGDYIIFWTVGAGTTCSCILYRY